MIKLLAILIFILSSFLQLSAQVSINTNGQPPTSGSMLDITSTSKGVLIPRLSATQKAAITFAPAGFSLCSSEI